MNTPPYSLSEAKNICADYQYLIGQQYDQSGSATVDCIAVAPFDQLSKSRFIIYYLLFEDAEMALTNEYKGLLFDVVVIAGSTEKRELKHEDIFTWLSKNKPFNMPVAAEVPLAMQLNYTGREL